MIFRKNKPAATPGNDKSSMRGRDGGSGHDSPSPLARRFVPGDEPETIDLVGPGGFHAEATEAEPETQVTSTEPPVESAGSDRAGILSHDPDTGKFYVHPGSAESPVMLAGEPVTATTELRKGDRISIADAEFEFLL